METYIDKSAEPRTRSALRFVEGDAGEEVVGTERELQCDRVAIATSTQEALPQQASHGGSQIGMGGRAPAGSLSFG